MADSVYISYDDLVLSTPGLEGYWRLDEGGEVFPDLADKTSPIAIDGTSRAYPLFEHSPANYFGEHRGGVVLPISPDVISGINSKREMTAIFWVARRAGSVSSSATFRVLFKAGVAAEMRVRLNDHSTYSLVLNGVGSTPPLPVFDVPVMFAVVLSGTSGRWFMNNEEIISRSTGWREVPQIEFLESTIGTNRLVFGHLSVYSRALTDTELNEQYIRRLFQGKISGTITLDGNPSAAMVRAFRRSDGILVGQTTAAVDGSYELTVVDNVQMDLLATPPDSSGARPLAHGPILPEPHIQ